MLAILAVLAAGCSSTSRDLTVRVTDPEGSMLPLAQVTLVELGNAQAADDDGEVTWIGLSEKKATLVVAAEGYYMETTQVNLKRGHNEVAISMTRGSNWSVFTRT
jgi:hypothetical protein